MASPTVQSLQASIEAQIASAPSISLQILGVHTVGEQSEVDFDLWIDYTKEAKMKSAKFLSNDQRKIQSWSEEETPRGDFLTTSYGWIKEWLNDGDGSKGWKVRQSYLIQEEELAALKTHVEGLARRTGYGGDTTSKIHTSPVDEDIPENTAILQVEWVPGQPFLPTERSWDLKILCRMQWSTEKRALYLWMSQIGLMEDRHFVGL